MVVMGVLAAEAAIEIRFAGIVGLVNLDIIRVQEGGAGDGTIIRYKSALENGIGERKGLDNRMDRLVIGKRDRGSLVE